MSNNTRWTISVSKEIDISLRSLLARRGVKKGGLSRFVEDAVGRQIFRENLEAVRAGFDDMSADKIQNLVDEAVRETRAAHQ